MNEPTGLFHKYNVQKADGSPVDPNADYFVLRLDTDPAACFAVLEYANRIYRDGQKDFAKELRKLARGYLYPPVDFSARDVSNSQLATWWLGNDECESLVETPMPRYLHQEMIGMEGRPLRGRLWVALVLDERRAGLPEIFIPMDENKPATERISLRGGIVFHRDELSIVKAFGIGFITDMELNYL